MPLLRSRRGLRMAGAVAAVALAAAIGLAGIDARATTVEEPANVRREAYFTYPLTQVTPPLLTTGFPPSTVCLVAGLLGVSDICGEMIQDIGALLGMSTGIPVPVTPDGDLVQPVAPGTTPIGMLGGQPRYNSLLQFALPELPEGHGFANLELILHQGGVNFAIESPAFRALVLAVMGQVSEQDPAVLLEDVADALSSGDLLTNTVTGIEACPATESWNGGTAQGAALDGTRLPDADCILGTTGVYDEAAGTWTFDLTFAAQAWTEGAPGVDPLVNEGILLRPVGAPNLAYGDPDLSTNWVVSVGDSTGPASQRPMLRYSTVPLEVEPDLPPIDPGPAVEPPGAVDPPVFAPIDGVVTPPTPRPAPPAALANSLRARWGESDASAGAGHLPAWAWLALPLGLAGTALFGQALVVPADAARRRPGALSQLVATNDARTASPPSPRS